MNRCSVCRKFGHVGTAHRQACAICGGEPVTKQFVEDVNPNWKCADEPRHRQIREGFGDPVLVEQGSMSVAQRKAKVTKDQLKLVE